MGYCFVIKNHLISFPFPFLCSIFPVNCIHLHPLGRRNVSVSHCLLSKGSMGWFFLMTAMSTFVGHPRRNPDYVDGSSKLLLFDVPHSSFAPYRLRNAFFVSTFSIYRSQPRTWFYICGYFSPCSVHSPSRNRSWGAQSVEGAGRRRRAPASPLGQQHKMQWCRLLPAWLGKQCHRIVEVGKDSRRSLAHEISRLVADLLVL